MSDKEKIECVQEVIKRTLKELPFTFDGLSIDLQTDPWIKDKMIITFRFNEFGNNNKTITHEQRG